MTPANTWSNLGFVVVGFFFYWLTRKEKSENLKFYGTAAQWVGWTSFIYHASLTFATQVLDFVGMFIFCYLLLIQNLARMKIVPVSRLKRTIWIATALSTVALSVLDHFGVPIQGAVLLLVVSIISTEFTATLRSSRPVKHRAFIASVLFLGIGAAFSASDVTRKFCDPNNHWIQGHAIWHYFGAISLLFSIYHYRQFYSKSTGELET